MFAKLTILAILCLIPCTVRADLGPKPEISILCTNLPEKEVYVDLLVDYPPLEEGQGFRIEDKDLYNPYMFSILESYNVDGFRPALVTGTSAPLWGDIRCINNNSEAFMTFSYFGVPDRFKIIAVTEYGTVVVSNLVEKKAYQAYIVFDYAKALESLPSAYERSPLMSYVLQFLFTWVATLIIEGLILLLFKFSLRKNWKPFLIINTATQIALTLIIALIAYNAGTAMTLLIYIPVEIVIAVVEIIAFTIFLKEHGRLRRAIYAVTANAASFIVGIAILIFTFNLTP
ncbi:MAG: hypothetical protein FWC47_03615 [Oscillospiraceae bacterium]|nr:hypothetical protein [Oscillospiraceae bacterium]